MNYCEAWNRICIYFPSYLIYYRARNEYNENIVFSKINSDVKVGSYLIGCICILMNDIVCILLAWIFMEWILIVDEIINWRILSNKNDI